MIVNANDNTVERMGTARIPLGITASPEYSGQCVSLYSEDVLILGTDGIAEAMNTAGQQEYAWS